MKKIVKARFVNGLLLFLIAIIFVGISIYSGYLEYKSSHNIGVAVLDSALFMVVFFFMHKFEVVPRILRLTAKKEGKNEK